MMCKHASKISQLPLSSNYTVEQALNAALNNGLRDVLIVGYNKDGDLFSVSSKMTRADANYLIDEAKDWTRYGQAKR